MNTSDVDSASLDRTSPVASFAVPTGFSACSAIVIFANHFCCYRAQPNKGQGKYAKLNCILCGEPFDHHKTGRKELRKHVLDKNKHGEGYTFIMETIDKLLYPLSKFEHKSYFRYHRNCKDGEEFVTSFYAENIRAAMMYNPLLTADEAIIAQGNLTWS